jgi:cell division protein FtsL
MARSAAAVLRPRRDSARRGVPRPGKTPPRRMSGSGAASAVLPGRLLNAPFARAARARTGGVLDALLSGRGWIALVFLLLAGIVFFNVDLMQMNRDIAHNAERISALKRANARLRLDSARLGSSERIQEAAAGLGLVLPAPGEVRYRKARPVLDARRAAKSITEPTPTVAPAPVIPTPAPTPTTPVAPAPVTPTAPAVPTTPTTPATPAPTAPTAPTAVPTDPTTTVQPAG